MKNILKFFVPVAVAATALVSCNKEIENPVSDPEAITIRVHAKANELKADDPATKTYIGTYQGTANSILWGTGEYMKLAITAGEATTFANSTDNSADLFDGEPEAMFEFSVNPATASEYVYQGLYPASAAATSSNTNAANYKVNLPAIQNATDSSYDPAAYIMVAQPETFTSVQDDWEASFRRGTALNKITLKNFASSVSINKVKITAEGKKLAGGRHFNLTTGESGDIYGNEATIDVMYATPLTGTSMDVWFTSWGTEIAAGEKLTIVAFTTDKKSYTKTITVPAGKTIKFQEGYLNTLGAKMENIAPETVTELQEGNYLVLAKSGESYYAMKAETVSNDTRMASVDYSGSTTVYAGDADMIWSVSKSGNSYILENDGKYLGFTGSDNKAFWRAPGTDWSENEYRLDITWDADNSCYHVTLNSTPTRKLQRMSSNDWFAFYTTAQQGDLVFVPATVDNRTPVTLSFAEDAISKTTANYSEFTGQTATATPSVSGITYAIDGDNIGTITAATGAVALNGNTGSATVTATFAGDATYRPASASYTIIVSDASTLTLTFPFDSAVSGWPSASGDSAAGSYTYNLSGTDYTFTHTKVGNGIYCQSSYLMIVSGNYLGLPAISGYKLSSVSAQLNAGGQPSTASKGTITSNTTGTVVTGGDEQTFDTKGQSKTFTLTGTAENTVYYLAISNKNFQCTEVVLVYEAATPDTRDEAGLAWKKGGVDADTDTASLEDDADILPTIALYNPNNLSVTYSSSEESIATINASGVITLVDVGETTISAEFAGNDDYKPAKVEYTLTVTDNRTPVVSYDFETVAKLNALVTSTSAEYSGYLTDAVVSFVPATNTAIVKDATGSVMIYKSGHGLKQGQTYTGAINVTAIKYNSLYSEITVWDATFTGAEAAVSPESVSLADLIGNYDDYQNAYVQVAGLTVSSVDGKNIHVTDGANSYVVYDNTSSVSVEVGEVITAIGTITKYQTTEEIKVWKAADVTVTASAPKAITFSQPAAGGTFTVSVGGSTITSGTTVASGTTVTLTATAATDYVFGSWSVTGATVADATAATTTFEMGTSAVNISAAFTNTSSTPSTYVDVLNQSWTGVEGTSYSGWTGKAGSASSAVYAGNSAGGNSSIQLRSNNNNSGVVSTTSGGKVKKIVVTWNSNTQSGRTLNVYGKNSAYSSATDLYNSSNQGTLLGTIVCGTSTELTITGDYTYIGFRSASGAMYLGEVDITWEN